MKPPNPLKRGKAQSDEELSEELDEDLGEDLGEELGEELAAGRCPPLEGVPERRGSKKTTQTSPTSNTCSLIANNHLETNKKKHQKHDKNEKT